MRGSLRPERRGSPGNQLQVLSGHVLGGSGVSPAQPKVEASPTGLRTDRGSGTSLSKALPERVSTGAALWGSLPEGKVCRQSSRKPF